MFVGKKQVARKGLIEKVTFQQWPEGSGGTAQELSCKSTALGDSECKKAEVWGELLSYKSKDVAIVTAAE